MDKGWREHNLEMAIDTVADIIEHMSKDGESPRTIAMELAECHYVRAFVHRRIWTYKKGSWTGPLVMIGGDEYGNWTLCLRLPGERALVIALDVPLKRRLLDE